MIADGYGKIKTELAHQGSLIPENDIWIAAVARQYDLIVITRDGHFSSVPQLNHARWE
jgi:tRNA(fMet)-specific endonuclease VapC